MPSALGFIAKAYGTPNDKRRAIGELLALIAENLPDPTRLRVMSASLIPNDRRAFDYAKYAFAVRWARGNAYAIAKIGNGNTYNILEYAPDPASTTDATEG